jgi:hypothetical protein
MAGLKEMGAKGVLTTQRLMQAILASGGAIEGEFARMTPTIGQALSVLGNKWSKFILDIQNNTGFFGQVAGLILDAVDLVGKGIDWVAKEFGTATPEMMAMLEDEPMLPKNNTMVNNLIVNTESVKLTSFSDNLLEMSGNYSTNTNPGFENMSLRNYNLTDDSVAYEKIPGFKKLVFDEMGRYDKHALYKVKDAAVFKTSSTMALVNGREKYFDEATVNVDGKNYIPAGVFAEVFGAENATVGAIELNGKSYVDAAAFCEKTGKKLCTSADGLVIISDDEITFNSYIDGKIAFYLNELLNVY